jgi:hypothetical protein
LRSGVFRQKYCRNGTRRTSDNGAFQKVAPVKSLIRHFRLPDDDRS